MNLLAKLNQQLHSLSKSERKVAQCVLEDPDAAIRMSMARLATTAKVSEPTVNRLCRSMGCNGFSDFKLQLAQELGSSSGTTSNYASRRVAVNDRAHEAAGKIFEATMAAVASAWGNMDASVLEKAIDALAQARKIQIFAFGDYIHVASMASQQFQYLNVIASAFVDPVAQSLAARNVQPGDVVLVLSCKGEHPVLLDNVKQALKSGATVLAITRHGSSLEHISHISLPADNYNRSHLLSPATPGIIAQTWIYALVKGVILRRGPGFIEHIENLLDED